MDRFDLTSVEGRLALVEKVFLYPGTPHMRRHGPQGYEDYESYRGWIRDDFSYRCVFSLFRETWPGFSFHLDHLVPQQERSDLINTYENLIYLEHMSNLSKGVKYLPDPCTISLRDCLFVHVNGSRVGEIDALNADGRRIVDTLRLDGWRATDERRKILGALRSLAVTDETLFREYVGYPGNLPNLSKTRPVSNTRPEGIEMSAQFLRGNGTLPEWI